MWPARRLEPWAGLEPKGGSFLLEASVCSAGLVAGILLELTVSPTAAGLVAPAGLLVFATVALLCVSQDMSQRVAQRRANKVPTTPTPVGPQDPQPASPEPQAQPQAQPQAPPGVLDWLLDSFVCCAARRGAEDELEPLIPIVPGQAPVPALFQRMLSGDLGDLVSGPDAELCLARPHELVAIEALAKELAPEITTLPPWDEDRIQFVSL